MGRIVLSLHGNLLREFDAYRKARAQKERDQKFAGNTSGSTGCRSRRVWCHAREFWHGRFCLNCSFWPLSFSSYCSWTGGYELAVRCHRLLDRWTSCIPEVTAQLTQTRQPIMNVASMCQVLPSCDAVLPVIQPEGCWRPLTLPCF